MNPIFTWIIARATADKLARRCPKCGHKQVVVKAKMKEAVPCARCGTMLQPART